jgi:hypothetical protein
MRSGIPAARSDPSCFMISPMSYIIILFGGNIRLRVLHMTIALILALLLAVMRRHASLR